MRLCLDLWCKMEHWICVLPMTNWVLRWWDHFQNCFTGLKPICRQVAILQTVFAFWVHGCVTWITVTGISPWSWCLDPAMSALCYLRSFLIFIAGNTSYRPKKWTDLSLRWNVKFRHMSTIFHLKLVELLADVRWLNSTPGLCFFWSSVPTRNFPVLLTFDLFQEDDSHLCKEGEGKKTTAHGMIKGQFLPFHSLPFDTCKLITSMLD